MSDFQINPNDFESIYLNISIFNKTAKTELKEGRRYIGFKAENITSEDLIIHIVELLKDGFILEVPQKTCSKNHLLEISIEFSNEDQEDLFRFHGTVIENAPTISNNRDSITVKVSPDALSEYKRFEATYLKRQEEIWTFFKAAKG